MTDAERSLFLAVSTGLGLGLVVDLPAVMAAIASGSAGHGHYVAARALFPVPMLLTLLEENRIGPLSTAAALLQFPIYGGLLGWSIVRRNYLPSVGVGCAHLLALMVCFAGALQNVS